MERTGSPTEVERCVERMVWRGYHFETIEAYIDDQDLDDETKAVLWLWAWAELPRAERRLVLHSARVIG